MTTRKFGEFVKHGDSVSLTKIDGQPFTIVASEDSNYENDKGGYDRGKKITTLEKFNIDGKDWSKFHTTRQAIVKSLDKPEILEALKKGEHIGPVKTEERQPKKGNNSYWVLVDA